MVLNRSQGGIGRLYDADALLGEVYYNIKRNQPPGQMICTVVFVHNEIELPNDNQRYRLFLEDGHYLVVALRKTRSSTHSPYSCISCDGVLHSELSYSHS